MKLSKRISEMQFSPIRKLVHFAEEAKQRGIRVIHLNIGQPDVKTPELFEKAVKNYHHEVLAYTDSQGIDPLLESFIKYYEKWNIKLDKDELLVTNGGSEAIIFAIMVICDSGDNVLVPEPFYTNYNGFTEVAGAKVLPFLTKAEDGFHLPTKEEIESKINSKTKAILISNPGNPTGVVYSANELRIIADIAKEKDLYIIADEVYREFVYDGLKYTSMMYLEDVADRVILIDSVSKRYSACGARIGLLASKNKEIIHQALKLCQSRLCVPTIEQIGAAALKDTPDSYFKNVNTEYQKRRDIMYEGLKSIPGIVCEKPTGAFYIVAKLPVKNAEDFAKWLLTDFNLNGTTVMVAPAAGFYATKGLGLDEVRLAYCLNIEELKLSIKILAIAIKEYNKK
jgi:aspartate aminotransferase